MVATEVVRTRTRLSPEARKNQLLDVSKEMILGSGLQEFSMEALARTANVSSPLVYNYFDSRLDTLQSLLAREYTAYIEGLNKAMAQAESFEAVVRVNIESNFDHFAPGNIIPILESQPEIAVAITDVARDHGRKLARYLVDATATNYKLNPREAELLVKMSSGASVAAAEYTSLGRVKRERAVDAALAYVMAGLAQAATRS